MLRWLSLFLKLAAGLAAAATGVAAFAAYSINSSRRRDLMDDYYVSPFELRVKHEDVDFHSDDGLHLRGWWFESEQPTERVLIGLTGRRVAKDSLIGIGTGLWRAGNHVLVFDFRGRGESQSGPQSVGHHELADVRAAIRFVRERRPQAKIGLFGFSMGGALAICAAAEDAGIRAVMADSAFTGLDDVLASSFAALRLPGRWLTPLANLMNAAVYGYDLRERRPLGVVARIPPRPVLLIHGAHDSTVPVHHAKQLYEAARSVAKDPGSVRLWIEAETEHCGTYFVDRDRYVRTVAEFFAGAFSDA